MNIWKKIKRGREGEKTTTNKQIEKTK